MAQRITTTDTRFSRLIVAPLTKLFFVRIGGRKHINDLIDTEALPGFISDLIRNVVRRTKLWPREKLDVAEELIAHFADGLEAGHTAEELVRDFGNQKHAAKLIRRGKLRNRPIWWQLQKRCRQVLLILTGLYVLAGVWLMDAKLTVSVDYLEEVNPVAVPGDDAEVAWPLYRKAFIAAGYVTLSDLSDSEVAKLVEIQRKITDGDESEWSTAKTLLDRNRLFLEQVRIASGRRKLGFIVRSNYRDYSREDIGFLYLRDFQHHSVPVEVREKFALIRDSVALMKLRHCHALFYAAQVISLDIRYAGEQGDVARIFKNCEAMFGLARHLREHLTVINEAYAHDVMRVALMELGHVVAASPDIFSPEQLQQLARKIEIVDELSAPMVEGLRACILDILQRSYDESGRLTSNAIRWCQFHDAESSRFLFDSSGSGLVAAKERIYLLAMVPAANVLGPSRSQLADEYLRALDRQAYLLSRPLWETLHQKSPIALQMEEWQRSGKSRFNPLASDHGSDTTFWQRTKSTIALRDATQVAIALTCYKRAHGEYPKSLDDLTPRFLPTPAIDHSTGKPLLYKLVDDQPCLYGRGYDGDDDGGLIYGRASRFWWPVIWMSTDGDWVLWPKPANVGAGKNR